MDVVLREATFPIDLFLLMGEHYVGDDKLGRRCHARRKTLELNLVAGGRNDLKRRLYRLLAELGIGREVVMYGVKPDTDSESEDRP